MFDVNSLYPSVMYEKPMPYGDPIYYEGKYQKDETYNLYIQLFRCQFELKKNKIPTIQIKNTLRFLDTEYLSSSDGENVILCLTSVDLDLFLDHYEIYDIEYVCGWKFKSLAGKFFNKYIDKWMELKIQATKDGNKSMRSLAKLMLNALYGKFALNPIARSKYPALENGVVKYKLGKEETRKAVYLPVGEFITAWARSKTIRAAQAVYERFVYADTDSLHILGTEIPDNLEIHETKLGAWKLESTFTRARFLRQKSYMEEINDNLKITCAGMPKECYQYVTWDNFHPGSSYVGKLSPKHVDGGIILKDIDFTIKK